MELAFNSQAVNASKPLFCVPATHCLQIKYFNVSCFCFGLIFLPSLSSSDVTVARILSCLHLHLPSVSDEDEDFLPGDHSFLTGRFIGLGRKSQMLGGVNFISLTSDSFPACSCTLLTHFRLLLHHLNALPSPMGALSLCNKANVLVNP